MFSMAAAAMPRCRFAAAAALALSIRTLALRNEVAGSLTGSQRPQIHGHARPHAATTSTAKRHVRLHPAPSGDTSKVPPKQ
jgi:hypothetical protein